MSNNVSTFSTGSRITVAVDNTDAEAAVEAALAAAASTQAVGASVEANAAAAIAAANAAVDQNTLATQQLLSVLATWVPPGAVMNLGSPINLLLAGEL